MYLGAIKPGVTLTRTGSTPASSRLADGLWPWAPAWALLLQVLAAEMAAKGPKETHGPWESCLASPGSSHAHRCCPTHGWGTPDPVILTHPVILRALSRRADREPACLCPSMPWTLSTEPGSELCDLERVLTLHRPHSPGKQGSPGIIQACSRPHSPTATQEVQPNTQNRHTETHSSCQRVGLCFLLSTD